MTAVTTTYAEYLAATDQFQCDGCGDTFDIDESVKSEGKKGPMFCPDCALADLYEGNT